MLPARPALISLVGTWNEYLPPLVMINNEALYPWPLGISCSTRVSTSRFRQVLAFVSLLTAAVIFLPYDLETYHCRPHFVRGKRVKYSSENGI
jgi:ABC-type glycerol-3-phosphate transport system permease component